MLGMWKTTINKTQSLFFRILSLDTVMWFEAVSGWDDEQQSNPWEEGLGWLNPSQLDSRADFHSQTGIMAQDRKPRQTLSHRLNKHSGWRDEIITWWTGSVQGLCTGSWKGSHERRLALDATHCCLGQVLGGPAMGAVAIPALKELGSSRNPKSGAEGLDIPFLCKALGSHLLLAWASALPVIKRNSWGMSPMWSPSPYLSDCEGG